MNGRKKKLIEVSSRLFEATEYFYGVNEGLLIKSQHSEKFTTLKELLNLSWIKPFSKSKEFGKFTVSEKPQYNYLMVENHYGNWWWIVAVLPKEFVCELPKFKMKYVNM